MDADEVLKLADLMNFTRVHLENSLKNLHSWSRDAYRGDLGSEYPENHSQNEGEQPNKALAQIEEALKKLNQEGINEAIKRVQELAEIAKYQKPLEE